MYAVIRAGGKQYRVAPGDVIEIEKLPQAGGDKVQFDEVLAFSGSEGELGKPLKAFVTGQVVEHGRRFHGVGQAGHELAQRAGRSETSVMLMVVVHGRTSSHIVPAAPDA